MRVHTNVRHSTVTITITQSCIISKLKRCIGQKSRFRTPHTFNAPFGVPVRILRYRLVRKKTRMWWWKVSEYFYSFRYGWRDEAPRVSDSCLHDRKPRRYAKDNRTEFNCTNCKSEAEVTNNKSLRSRYCTVEANCCRHEASRGLSVTAELLVTTPVVSVSHTGDWHKLYDEMTCCKM